MKYRDYQKFAIESIFQYFRDGNTGNPIVAAPTGTGKSIMIGGFVKEACLQYRGQRMMMLTHVRELIEQNLSKLLALWPTAPAGVYSAGLGRKETEYPLTYAGVASVVNVIEQFGHIDILLIDECHLLSPKAGTMYQKVIKGLRKANPALKVIGFTATPWRVGQGLLTDGGIFTDICCDMTGLEPFNWFIDQGYLCPLVPKSTAFELDTSNVRINAGEYNQNELQHAVDQEAITEQALMECMEHGLDRNRWLVFASGVQHAVNVSNMLNDLGVKSTYIHSRMGTKERDKRLADTKRGEYRAIVNNGILTTGYDDPAIDMIVMLRPTRSTGLWVQMNGRGTRPLYAPGFDLETQDGRLAAIAASDKQDCLVMDFAGNTRRLGPINDPVMPRKKGSRGGEAPFRYCEACGEHCHASLRFCPYCGHQFPVISNLAAQAGTEELIKKKRKEDPVVEEFKVDRVVYTEHRREGRPPTLKVSYYCGLRKFDEYVCLEHTGYAHKKARTWWSERTDAPLPTTVQEAFQRMDEIPRPAVIVVWVNKKYPDVLSARFE